MLLTSDQIISIMDKIEKEMELELNYECDGRYVWPERWRRLKTELNMLHHKNKE